MSRKLLLALVGGLLLAALALPVGVASAHERRQVGDVWLVVGFLAEPAFQNAQNGLDLTVYSLKPGTDPAKQTAADRVPITDLEKSLKAEVIKDGQTMPLTITARFNVPGSYNGVFFPTAAGDYTFHVSGAVNGKNVDEKFTSGNGFNKVDATGALQFPVKVGSNQDLEAKVSKLGGDDDGSTALVVAIVAAVLGLVGVGLGGASFARGRSKA